MTDQEIDDIYFKAIEPKKILATFTNNEDLVEWLKLGTKEDCQCFLQVLEYNELFEECVIVRDYIKGLK